MNDDRRFRRLMAYLLIGSIVFGAVLALVIVLRDTWSWFELRVAGTTVTIAVASVCGLACDLARTPLGSNRISLLGMALTFASAGLFLVGIWADIDAEAYGKTTACVITFAAAAVQVCLLSIAKLSRRFAWVYVVACQAAFALAVLVSIMIVGEIDGDGVMKTLLVLSILDAALSLAIPVLHRLSKLDEPSEELLTPLGLQSVAAIDAEIDRLRRRISQLQTMRDEIVG